MKKKVFIFIHTKDRPFEEVYDLFNRVTNALRLADPEEYDNIETNNIKDLYNFTNTTDEVYKADALKNIYLAMRSSITFIDVHCDYTDDYRIIDALFYSLPNVYNSKDNVKRLELNSYLFDREYCEYIRKKHEADECCCGHTGYACGSI